MQQIFEVERGGSLMFEALKRRMPLFDLSESVTNKASSRKTTGQINDHIHDVDYVKAM